MAREAHEKRIKGDGFCSPDRNGLVVFYSKPCRSHALRLVADPKIHAPTRTSRGPRETIPLYIMLIGRGVLKAPKESVRTIIVLPVVRITAVE